MSTSLVETVRTSRSGRTARPHDTLLFEVRPAPLKPTFDFDHWNRFKNQ